MVRVSAGEYPLRLFGGAPGSGRERLVSQMCVARGRGCVVVRENYAEGSRLAW